MKRASLGFDLRVNPDLQQENPAQLNQHLAVGMCRNPISADASVWLETDEIESLTERVLPEFANPLHLWKSIEALIQACERREISTNGLWPVSVTCSESNVVALAARFGPEFFDNLPTEEELLSSGWRFVGFDVIDLDGLISGLKGCGYVEPTWSLLRNIFGGELNQVGLFNEYSAASHFAEVRGLQIRAHAPFVVAGLLTKGVML